MCWAFKQSFSKHLFLLLPIIHFLIKLKLKIKLGFDCFDKLSFHERILWSILCLFFLHSLNLAFDVIPIFCIFDLLILKHHHKLICFVCWISFIFVYVLSHFCSMWIRSCEHLHIYVNDLIYPNVSIHVLWDDFATYKAFISVYHLWYFIIKSGFDYAKEELGKYPVILLIISLSKESWGLNIFQWSTAL